MLIFLYGADTFRSSEKLRSLKNKYIEKNSSGSGLSVLDFDEQKSIESLSQTFGSQGLFSEKRLVILQNCLLSLPVEKQKEVLSVLKEQKNIKTDAELTVIFFEFGMPKKTTSLFKYLFANGTKQEFTPLDQGKLLQWAISETKKHSDQISFSKKGLDLLLSSTGNDLHILSQEIAKLVNYKNFGEISESDVSLLVKSKNDTTIFETIEALSSGKKSLAISLLHGQIAKGEDIFYLLSMYTYHVRTLMRIGEFFYSGISVPAQIAQATGLHPYVIQKSLYQLRMLSEDKIKKMFKELAIIDQDAKTGKKDPLLALDQFIVSL